MVMFSLTLWLSASLIVRWWETHGLPDSYFLKFVEISFTDKNTINFWKFSRDYSEDCILYLLVVELLQIPMSRLLIVIQISVFADFLSI